MNTTLESAREAVKERIAPSLKSLEQNMREARRAIACGRRATDDVVNQATRQIKGRPLTSVAVAVGAGALVGCIVGFAFGLNARRGSSAAGFPAGDKGPVANDSGVVPPAP